MIINEDIRARELRVIGDNGEQIGVKSLNDALTIAESFGLDLVLVSPNAKPPVARIMDYGKYRYEMQKKEKEQRKNQKIVITKPNYARPSSSSNMVTRSKPAFVSAGGPSPTRNWVKTYWKTSLMTQAMCQRLKLDQKWKVAACSSC